MKIELEFEDKEEVAVLDTALALVTKFCVEGFGEDEKMEGIQIASILLSVHKQIKNQVDI